MNKSLATKWPFLRQPDYWQWKPYRMSHIHTIWVNSLDFHGQNLVFFSKLGNKNFVLYHFQVTNYGTQFFFQTKIRWSYTYASQCTLECPRLWRITMISIHNQDIYKWVRGHFQTMSTSFGLFWPPTPHPPSLKFSTLWILTKT